MAARSKLGVRKRVRQPTPKDPRTPEGCIGICYWCHKGVPYGSGWTHIVAENATRLIHGSTEKCRTFGIRIYADN